MKSKEYALVFAICKEWGESTETGTLSRSLRLLLRGHWTLSFGLQILCLTGLDGIAAKGAHSLVQTSSIWSKDMASKPFIGHML